MTALDTLFRRLRKLTVQFSDLNISNSSDAYNNGSIKDLDAQERRSEMEC